MAGQEIARAEDDLVRVDFELRARPGPRRAEPVDDAVGRQVDVRHAVDGLGVRQAVLLLDRVALDARVHMAADIKYVLVVATEELSKFVDYEDRSTCILFGDAAAAVVLETLNNAIDDIDDKIAEIDDTLTVVIRDITSPAATNNSASGATGRIPEAEPHSPWSYKATTWWGYQCDVTGYRGKKIRITPNNGNPTPFAFLTVCQTIAIRVGVNVVIRVIVGGVISGHKGVNLPNSSLNISPLTPKDLDDLHYVWYWKTPEEEPSLRE